MSTMRKGQTGGLFESVVIDTQGSLKNETAKRNFENPGPFWSASRQVPFSIYCLPTGRMFAVLGVCGIAVSRS